MKIFDPTDDSLHPERLADRVYERLQAHIRDGQFSPGTRLPSEGQLASMFNVSRPLVREALSRLRNNNLITSRKGSGSFVMENRDQGPVMQVVEFVPITSLSQVKQLYDFRLGVEGEAAYLAALHRTERHLQTIGDALDNLQKAIENRAVGVDPDYAFHLAIARASTNSFVETVMLSMHQAMKFVINLSRSLSLTRPVERLRVVEAEHKAIYEAIRLQNALEARAAMQRHILNTVDRVFEGGSLEQANGFLPNP